MPINTYENEAELRVAVNDVEEFIRCAKEVIEHELDVKPDARLIVAVARLISDQFRALAFAPPPPPSASFEATERPTDSIA